MRDDARRATIAAMAVAFSWTSFLLGCLVLPAGFLFRAAIAVAPFFGEQPDAADRALASRYLLEASITATSVAVAVLVVTLALAVRGRRLVNGWIVLALASLVSVLLWTEVAAS